MQGIPFAKLEGIGNDYVYLDGLDPDGPPLPADPAGLARRVADRHFGVGADGLILLMPPARAEDADIRMRMFNADGSEAEMCGNGIRGLCKLAHDRGYVRTKPMRIETAAGVKTVDYARDAYGAVETVTVDMGRADARPDALPLAASVRGLLIDAPIAEYLADVLDPPAPEWAALGLEPTFTCLAVGNPHLVLFVRDVEGFPLARVGPALEHHALFPLRINVHVVRVDDPGTVTMRTWERGSGLTLACGTGASAVAAAAVRTRGARDDVVAHLPGGDLRLRYDRETEHIWMTGPARLVFTGIWRDPSLSADRSADARQVLPCS